MLLYLFTAEVTSLLALLDPGQQTLAGMVLGSLIAGFHSVASLIWLNRA